MRNPIVFGAGFAYNNPYLENKVTDKAGAEKKKEEIHGNYEQFF